MVSLQTCELSSVKLHCNALNNRHLKMVKIGVADRDNSVCSMVICKFYRGCFLLIPTCYFFVFGFKLNWFPKCLYFSTIGETSLVGSPTHRNYFLEPVEIINEEDDDGNDGNLREFCCGGGGGGGQEEEVGGVSNWEETSISQMVTMVIMTSPTIQMVTII